jgi:hypothetical protein
VLDQFAGSGTTILAAEKVGRIGFGVEYEPGYVAEVLHLIGPPGTGKSHLSLALKKKVMVLKRRYSPSTLLIADSPISLGLIQSLVRPAGILKPAISGQNGPAPVPGRAYW